MSEFSRVTTLKGQRLLGYDPINKPQGIINSPKNQQRKDYFSSLPITQTKYTSNYQPINPPIQYNVQGGGNYPRNYNNPQQINQPFHQNYNLNQNPSTPQRHQKINYHEPYRNIRSPIHVFNSPQINNNYKVYSPPPPSNFQAPRYQTSIVQPYPQYLPTKNYPQALNNNNQYNTQHIQQSNQNYSDKSGSIKKSKGYLEVICCLLLVGLSLLVLIAGIIAYKTSINNKQSNIEQYNFHKNDQIYEKNAQNEQSIANEQQASIQAINLNQNNQYINDQIQSDTQDVSQNSSQQFEQQTKSVKKMQSQSSQPQTSYRFPPKIDQLNNENEITDKEVQKIQQDQQQQIVPQTSFMIPSSAEQTAFMIPSKTQKTAFMIPPKHQILRNFIQ